MLEDPAVEVVFHDADYDLRLLHQDYGWHVRNIFDTRIAAQLLGIKRSGSRRCSSDFFGVKLDKKHQRADWSMRPLTQGHARLRRAGHAAPARPARRAPLPSSRSSAGWSGRGRSSRGSRGPSGSRRKTALSFLRMKGARDLTRRELALLRELVPWRDSVARELDRATFRVMGNEVLLDIARTAPRDAKQLSGLKGMPRGILERGGAAILSAVKRGLEVAEEHLPKFPRAAKWEREEDFEAKVTKLKAVRDAAATRLSLDPGVLCSRERLEAIVRRKPDRVKNLEDVPGLRRWQIAEMGEEFVEALRT